MNLSVPLYTPRVLFGSWLKERINERRMPTSHIAKAAGVDYGQLSNALAGRRQITGATYLRIAKLLTLDDARTQEGLELWRSQHRPVGRKGSQELASLRQQLHDKLAEMAKEEDPDERHLIGAEIRFLISKL